MGGVEEKGGKGKRKCQRKCKIGGKRRGQNAAAQITV